MKRKKYKHNGMYIHALPRDGQMQCPFYSRVYEYKYKYKYSLCTEDGRWPRTSYDCLSFVLITPQFSSWLCFCGLQQCQMQPRKRRVPLSQPLPESCICSCFFQLKGKTGLGKERPYIRAASLFILPARTFCNFLSYSSYEVQILCPSSADLQHTYSKQCVQVTGYGLHTTYICRYLYCCKSSLCVATTTPLDRCGPCLMYYGILRTSTG